jgi:hypothetical protein
MVETSCAGCVFAKTKDGKQYGCSLNRLEKLEHSETETRDDIEYKKVSRFCNTYRPEQWLDNMPLDEQMKADDVVMQEVRPRVGFLVHLDHDKENPLNYLESTLMGIRDQSESEARYVIVTNTKVEYNEQIHQMLRRFFDEDKTEIHILQILEAPENNFWLVDEAFRLALNGWLYVTTSGEQVDRNLLKDLHEHINLKLKKLSIVLPYDDINGFLVQTSLFKYLNGNKTKVWDLENKDSRMFLDKAKDLDKNGDCILEWSQVNVA